MQANRDHGTEEKSQSCTCTANTNSFGTSNAILDTVEYTTSPFLPRRTGFPAEHAIVEVNHRGSMNDSTPDTMI